MRLHDTFKAHEVCFRLFVYSDLDYYVSCFVFSLCVSLYRLLDTFKAHEVSFQLYLF